MEKIINTIKYTETIKNIFIVAAFLISSPAIVFAQSEFSDPRSGGGDIIEQPGVDDGNLLIQDPVQGGGGLLERPGVDNGNGLVYPPNVQDDNSSIYEYPNYGYNDNITSSDFPGYDDYDYSQDYLPNSYDSYGVYGGSYPSYYNYGGYGQGYGYGYGIGSRFVYSGGYVGGYSTYDPSGSYFGQSDSEVISGGYNGGTSSYTDPSGYYNYSNSSDVYSGGYSGGNNNYVYSSSYAVPPLSTVYSSNYSGIGLTSETIPNQVLAYTDTNPGLASVYLSDIPSTGITDYFKTIIFMSILVLWSALMAYILLNKEIKSKMILAVADVNEGEVNKIENPATSDLLNKINLDHSDINKVAEYARMKKVLLSSDALAKIVKLSRLGKINASEYIRGMATGEWVAIGEDRIS